jgi:hypothetical protein
MIERVTVSAGNHIEIDFQISLAQFLNEAQNKSNPASEDNAGKITAIGL